MDGQRVLVTAGAAGIGLAMAQAFVAAGARVHAAGTTVEVERPKALDSQSIKAFTDPADIDALAVFLAGPHGRSISGPVLPIDGASEAAQ